MCIRYTVTPVIISSSSCLSPSLFISFHTEPFNLYLTFPSDPVSPPIEPPWFPPPGLSPEPSPVPPEPSPEPPSVPPPGPSPLVFITVCFISPIVYSSKLFAFKVALFIISSSSTFASIFST